MPNQVDDDGIDVTIHNGFRPFLNLKVHGFIPKDPAVFEHMLWSNSGTPGLERHSSTYYGLQEQISDQILDRYLDQNVPYVIEDLKRGTGPNVLIEYETNSAAYRHSLGDSTLVKVSHFRYFRCLLTLVFRRSSCAMLCGYGSDRRSSSGSHGVFAAQTPSAWSLLLLLMATPLWSTE